MVGSFRWLPKARWKRWMILIAISGALVVLSIINLVVTAFFVWQNPKVQSWVMLKILTHQIREPASIPPRPNLSNDEAALLSSQGSSLRTPAELFEPGKVWDVRLTFDSNQWNQMGPSNIVPVPHFLQSDGSVILRNPNASRNGLAGVLGLDFPWSEAELEFGDAVFRRAGARFKGNGTFLGSERSYKRPFKIQLDRFDKAMRLAGLKTLNFHNLTADASCVSDTMAYEFFRNAGVPASHTAFARLRLSIGGRFDDRLLGLYVMVENVDSEWAYRQFGVEGVALFKPVTYELFKDLGEDWANYERIYDPKTKLKSRQCRRLIALAKLVSHAGDAEFAKNIDEFVDQEEFAAFLACQALLSNYDGFLSNGQNFLLYLDPRTDRFGFIPWDLDQCWGEFGYIGTTEQRERASLWHPWVGENRFLERMLTVPAFRAIYRRRLEELRATLFRPELLGARLDELVKIVRPFVKEESARRLARFDHQTREAQLTNSTNTATSDAQRRGFVLRQFFTARAREVTQQLEGQTQGIILTRRSGR